MTWGVAGDITLFPKIEKPLGLSDPGTLWALLIGNLSKYANFAILRGPNFQIFSKYLGHNWFSPIVLG